MERLCEVCNQIKESPYKNICRSCYQIQWEKTLDKTCPDCNKKFSKAGKYCANCARTRKLEKRGKQTCSGCGREGLLIINFGYNFCTKCDRNRKDKEIAGYREKRIASNRKFGRLYKGYRLDELDAPPKEKSKGWWKTANGYIMTYKKGHPNANVNDCINQHILIMSEHLGRPLLKNENVHHINGIRDDNRIENLELWYRSQPPGQRVEDKIKWAKEFLEQYGFKIDDKEIINI